MEVEGASEGVRQATPRNDVGECKGPGRFGELALCFNFKRVFYVFSNTF